MILTTFRYYDPSAGRFLNRDPIGYDGGINLYGYCGNGATGKSDPSGMFVVVIVAVVHHNTEDVSTTANHILSFSL